MTQRITFSATVPLQAKATAQGRITGLASPFGGEPDAYGDVVAPGAFAASLRKHIAEGTAPAMLWAHDQARPIGTWERLEERADGLHVEGQLALATKDGAESFEHLKAGAVTGLSIGFVVAPKGADYTATGRLLKEVDLAEISLVTIPAARAARVSAVKGAPMMIGSQGELEAALREIGLSCGAAALVAKGGWPALAKNDDNDTATRLAAILRKAANAM